jgi:hypothetical protein
MEKLSNSVWIYGMQSNFGSIAIKRKYHPNKRNKWDFHGNLLRAQETGSLYHTVFCLSGLRDHLYAPLLDAI